MIAHRADVVVCDGFVGNVVIKFFEGITSFIFRALREDLQQGPIAPLALLALRPGFDRLKARFDYERYGGAPLLGVKGVSIVTHGRAKARMIEHAMRVASESAEARVPELIAEWTQRASGPGASGRPVADRRPAPSGAVLTMAASHRLDSPRAAACWRVAWRCSPCSRMSSARVGSARPSNASRTSGRWRTTSERTPHGSWTACRSTVPPSTSGSPRRRR